MSSVIRLVQIGLGLIISILCIWLALKDVPLLDLGALLAGVSPLWILLALLSQLVSLVARVARWWYLLGGRARLENAFWAQAIGFFFTNVFPLRMGEPARIVALTLSDRVPLAHVAATVVLERLFDVACIVLLLIGLLPLVDVPDTVRQAGLLFGTLAALGFCLVIGLTVMGETGCRLVDHWLARVLPGHSAILTARWREAQQGLAVALHPSTLLPVLGWTLATWLCSITTYWCVLRAFSTNGQLIEAALMVVALSLAFAVPSTPGFFGIAQWVGQQALLLPFAGRYTATSALGVSITGHLVYYVLTTGLGIIGLGRLGQSITNLRRAMSRLA